MKQDRITRREMLKTAAFASAAPCIIPASALGRNNAVSPGDRLNIGIIGCGKMAGDYHLSTLLNAQDVQIVAIAEVDRTRRDHAKQRVEKAYSEKKDYKGCDAYNDFREITSRDDIDAVCIATPDHWHTIPIIEACKAGKDVYCEKPLTLTIAESRACIDAVRKYDRVFQTGSQQRSNVFGKFRNAVEIIRSGRLGKVERVTVGVGAPSIPCDLPEEQIEPGLDWNMWLGQAPMRPYNSVLSPRGVHNHFPAWRNYREYSGGGHTDMGAHHYDIAQWALDMDHSGPVEIIPPSDPAAVSGVKYRYANGVVMEHGGPSGCTFYGSEGTLRIDRGVLKSDPEEIVKEPLGKDDVRLPQSPGHHRNWLDCIRSRQKCIADVEFGARTAAVIHLGNLAYWHRKTLRWNPETWQFQDAADNKLLDRDRRDPWQLPAV
ncbi:MAG: Gfo/Idh/MocA family oxidoreductase [Planctomycetales bacterium]|nr:Gfo/Idh/MocA family oxidoreductase [Planctomycetales bacterium]